MPLDKQAINYEIKIDNIKEKGLISGKEDVESEWIDLSFPPVLDEESGDYETALMWLGEDYAKLGFTTMIARSVKLPNYLIKELEQTVHLSISVLTQTDFKKVVQELGLDLSSYSCIHPN